MKECLKCGTAFPTKIIIDGKLRNLQRRKFCLDCSAFGSHNTVDLSSKEKRTDSEKRKARSLAVIKRRRKVKLKLLQYKGGRCIICGYDKKIPGAYAFHHRDSSTKKFGIATKGHCRSWSEVKKEADKCDLLCVRCHAEVHHSSLKSS